MTFITIHTPPVMPPKRQDTYRDDLTAKLGKIPSMAELARRETLAAKRTWGSGTPISQGISITAEETLQRRTAWAKRLLPLSPITSLEAAIAWGGIDNRSAASRMASLENGGFAVRISGKRPILWEVKI